MRWTSLPIPSPRSAWKSLSHTSPVTPSAPVVSPPFCAITVALNHLLSTRSRFSLEPESLLSSRLSLLLLLQLWPVTTDTVRHIIFTPTSVMRDDQSHLFPPKKSFNGQSAVNTRGGQTQSHKSKHEVAKARTHRPVRTSVAFHLSSPRGGYRGEV